MALRFFFSQRLFFIIYWALCFLATHIPPSGVPQTTIPHIDKVVHFGIYFGLAFWGVSVRLARPLLFSLVLVGYGVIDELTQPWFQREADMWDFILDTVGIAVGAILARSLLSKRNKF